MTEPAATTHIITEEQLGADRRFEGADHGVDVSAFLVDAAPGRGPKRHLHPYTEIFDIHTAPKMVTEWLE